MEMEKGAKMGRGEGKGVKGAYAKEEWMGGKEVGESVMGCKICEMEIGKSGWERSDWRGEEEERETQRARGKEPKGIRQENRARRKRKGGKGTVQGPRAKGTGQVVMGKG